MFYSLWYSLYWLFLLKHMSKYSSHHMKWIMVNHLKLNFFTICIVATFEPFQGGTQTLLWLHFRGFILDYLPLKKKKQTKLVLINIYITFMLWVSYVDKRYIPVGLSAWEESELPLLTVSQAERLLEVVAGLLLPANLRRFRFWVSQVSTPS